MHNRKINSGTYHDFGDGNGPVAAHHHPFGNGWVADSTHVDETAFVGINARVFGNATVKGDAIVSDHAQISGFCTIRDQACVRGNAIVTGACIIQDDVEISDDTFINRHICLKGHLLLKHAHICADRNDCLNCPALLDDNYGATRNNPCFYCLKKMKAWPHLSHWFTPACRPDASARALKNIIKYKE